MKLHTAVLRIVTAGMLMAIAGSVAAQQAYPSRPIRIIVPYVPGGSVTLWAHLVGQKLTESWGHQVIVDNRPGGNSTIGTEAVAKAPADGYTLMLTSSSHVSVALLSPTSYDAIKDFAPVATLARAEELLVVNPQLPANTLQEFIALAKSKPGQLNFGSSGSGGPSRLAAEVFSIMTGVKMQHIPYKGGGQAITDLMGGQIQLYFTPALPVIGFIEGGKLKAIAISGDNRLATLPQVPTFTEAGLPGLDVAFWYGIFAPANTPRPIVEKLSAEVTKILDLPDTKKKLAGEGMLPFISPPDRFAALIKAEWARLENVIKVANIKLEN